jgi:hypothetical protein
MSLFGNDNLDLESILANQAQTGVAGIQDQYAQKKRRLAGQLAGGGSGRYRSGVGNYQLGDLDAEQAGAESGVYQNLATTLGGIPATDYLDQMGYKRSDSLSRLIGSLNKPSSLQEALGMAGQAGNIASKFAAFL